MHLRATDPGFSKNDLSKAREFRVMERNWILFMFFAFIVVSAGFVSIHQVQNEEDRMVGNDRPDTVDLAQCSEEARMAAQQVGNVYSCESKALNEFTVVDLGSDPMNDCPSGCFPTVHRFAVFEDRVQYVGSKYGQGLDLNGTMKEGETMVELDSLPMNATLEELAE